MSYTSLRQLKSIIMTPTLMPVAVTPWPSAVFCAACAVEPVVAGFAFVELLPQAAIAITIAAASTSGTTA